MTLLHRRNSLPGLIRDNTTPGEYVLYPKPHDIKYTNQAVDLSDGIAIYYEDGVDEYIEGTPGRNLEDNNISYSETDTMDQSGAVMMLGIYGSGQAVDQSAAGIADASLFQKTDAYLIEMKGDKSPFSGRVRTRLLWSTTFRSAGAAGKRKDSLRR